MIKETRLGVFDIDGTISTDEIIPSEVLKGFEEMWHSGVTTTVMTGKRYVRVRESLGANFGRIISPNAPVAVENAGRITDHDGTNNLYFFPLAKEEIITALLALREQEVRLVMYSPEDTRRKPLLWVPPQEKVDEMASRFGHYAEIIVGTKTDLEKRMQQDKPCMITFNPYDISFINELLSQKLNAFANEGLIAINAEKAGKGSGVNALGEHFGYNPEEIMVAGNGLNDLPMLNLAGINRIVVGSDITGFVTTPYTQVDNPRELGTWLSNSFRTRNYPK